MAKIPPPEENFVTEYGVMIHGLMDRPFSADKWLLDAKQGSSIVLDITTLEQGEYGPYHTPAKHHLELLDASGGIQVPTYLEAARFSSQQEYRVYYISSTGTYTIQIYSEGKDTFNYQFKVWNSEPPEVPTITEIGEVRHQTLTHSAPESLWRFTITESGNTWLDVTDIRISRYSSESPSFVFSVYNQSGEVVKDFNFLIQGPSIPFLEAKGGNWMGELTPGDYQMRVKSDVLPADYSFQIRHDRVDSPDRSVSIKMSPDFANRIMTLRPVPIYAGWRYHLQHNTQIVPQPDWTLLSSKSASESVSGWSISSDKPVQMFRIRATTP